MILRTCNFVLRSIKIYMIHLHLQPIFAARGIDKPFSFLIRSGFTYPTAHNLLNNKLSSLKLSYIEKLCDCLVCEPNDLFLWTPDKNKMYPENYPLKILTRAESSLEFRQAIQSIPYKDLIHASKSFGTFVDIK
jgi:DNA-binding Xre family transcriptional regulator